MLILFQLLEQLFALLLIWFALALFTLLGKGNLIGFFPFLLSNFLRLLNIFAAFFGGLGQPSTFWVIHNSAHSVNVTADIEKQELGLVLHFFLEKTLLLIQLFANINQNNFRPLFGIMQQISLNHLSYTLLCFHPKLFANFSVFYSDSNMVFSEIGQIYHVDDLLVFQIYASVRGKFAPRSK